MIIAVNWKEEAWKKNQGFNGIRARDLRDTGAMLYQLSYEATRCERGQFYWVHISREEWNEVRYTWNNSYLYCGSRWKWRMIIQLKPEEAWKKSGLQRDSNTEQREGRRNVFDLQLIWFLSVKIIYRHVIAICHQDFLFFEVSPVVAFLFLPLFFSAFSFERLYLRTAGLEEHLIPSMKLFKWRNFMASIQWTPL